MRRQVALLACLGLTFLASMAVASSASAANGEFGRTWNWTGNGNQCTGTNYMAYNSARTKYSNTRWRFHYHALNGFAYGDVWQYLDSGSTRVYSSPMVHVESYRSDGDIVGRTIGAQSTVGSTHVHWRFEDYGNHSSPYNTPNF